MPICFSCKQECELIKNSLLTCSSSIKLILTEDFLSVVMGVGRGHSKTYVVLKDTLKMFTNLICRHPPLGLLYQETLIPVSLLVQKISIFYIQLLVSMCLMVNFTVQVKLGTASKIGYIICCYH